MRSVIRTVLTSAVLAGLVAAQGAEPPRERVFGIARTTAGEAWVGATVELLARPIADDETVGVPDHLFVTTDVRGRFAAGIRPGLAYTVWAWQADGEGRYRTSDVVDGVVPRQAVVLTQHGEERWQRPIELDLEPGIAGPVAVFVRAKTANVLVLELPADAAAARTLPALPPVEVELEVFDADGVPLVGQRVDPTVAGACGLAVPARVPVRVLLRHIDTERAPIEPVVAVRWGTRVVPLGALDADGCGEAAVPKGGRAIAYAKSCAGAGVLGEPEPEKHQDGAAWPPLREGFDDRYHAHVGPGVTLRGRVLLGPDRPAVGAWLAVAECTLHYTERNSRSLDRVRRTFRTDADGRFEIPHLLKEFPPSIALVLAPEHVAALPDSWGAGFGGVVPSFVSLGDIDGLTDDADFDLGELDSLQFVPTRLRISTPEGTPAMGAVLALEEFGAAALSADLPMSWIADRTGELSLLLPRERSWCAIVRAADQSVDLFALQTPGHQAVHEPVELPISMEPSLFVTGRALDGDGRPVEGIGVRLQPGGRIVLGEATLPAAGGDGPVVVDRRVDPRTFSRVARTRLATPGTIRTDADGRFRIPVPRIAMRYRLMASGVNIDVQVDGEQDPDPLEFEVSR